MYQIIEYVYMKLKYLLINKFNYYNFLIYLLTLIINFKKKFNYSKLINFLYSNFSIYFILSYELQVLIIKELLFYNFLKYLFNIFYIFLMT